MGFSHSILSTYLLTDIFIKLLHPSLYIYIHTLMIDPSGISKTS
jgi:hypothetical protein